MTFGRTADAVGTRRRLPDGRRRDVRRRGGSRSTRRQACERRDQRRLDPYCGSRHDAPAHRPNGPAKLQTISFGVGARRSPEGGWSTRVTLRMSSHTVNGKRTLGTTLMIPSTSMPGITRQPFGPMLD